MSLTYLKWWPRGFRFSMPIASASLLSRTRPSPFGVLGRDIKGIWADGDLQTIPGVGKGIALAIAELLETGEVAEFDELAEQVPDGVVAMLDVPDLGPKKAVRVWQELGVTSIDQLREAAEAGQIRGLKGFGAKSEEKILHGIELLALRGDERTPIGEARPLALALVDGLLEALPADTIERIGVAGSMRRWCDTIGDVDILAVSADPASVMTAFVNLPLVGHVSGQGATKSSVVLNSGLQVDLRVVEAQHWGAALQYFTGSKEHNVPMRELAQRQGWSLNEYGLTATGKGKVSAGEQRFFDEEAALYEFLGVDWIPPELRENRGEIERAKAHKLPDLITLDQIQGELHGHTTWSDGTASIEEMAEAARARGYRYWSVADHSVGLGIVQGVDESQLQTQAEEIAKLNRRYVDEGVDFRLLRGIEAEVLADGTLGVPDEVLAGLDVVVASIHSGQRQDQETITERCLRVVHNPHVDILGHPTGRLIGRRPPSDLDVERVLQACARTGTVVEINASPSRLDLKDVYARRAVELGCKIAINSDAHATDGMDIMEYGVATARRGWLTAEDVINTRPVDEMLGMLKACQNTEKHSQIGKL
jgi:DNA polymerase (family 10)